MACRLFEKGTQIYTENEYRFYDACDIPRNELNGLTPTQAICKALRNRYQAIVSSQGYAYCTIDLVLNHGLKMVDELGANWQAKFQNQLDLEDDCLTMDYAGNY